MNHFCLVTLAKHFGVATKPLTIRVRSEVIHRGVERSGKIDVVAVDESKYITSRLLQTFVDRMNLAPVLLADPICQAIFVTLDYFHAFVSASAVNDYVLEWLVSLIEHRQDGLFEKSTLVERWRDDAEFCSHTLSDLELETL